ncbi:Integrase/recombinase xerD like protein [Termitomyces sp. T112]|nr:Integrase/recombinase xerD like protein [Termitomyces sp. T112]
MGQSSQLPNLQSSPGLRASAAEFSPRRLRPTSQQFIPFTSMLTLPFPQSSHLLYYASSEASSATTANLQPGIVAGHGTIYAACCLAYSGLLRSGKFTVGKSNGKYNPSLNLSRTSIKFFPDFKDATHTYLTLPASKTDPFHKGVTITVAAAPSHPSCPIAALKALFTELPQEDDAPLFEQPDGKALSYTDFVKSIREALSMAGFNPSLYAGHSFRRFSTYQSPLARDHETNSAFVDLELMTDLHGLLGTPFNTHIAAGKRNDSGRPWHRHDLRAITTGAQVPVQPGPMLSAEQSLDE